MQELQCVSVRAHVSSLTASHSKFCPTTEVAVSTTAVAAAAAAAALTMPV